MFKGKGRRGSWFDCRHPGLVFLIYRNETKRALLPNEITSIDTVRALFVRSFPDQLSMSFLESPSRRIYIMDPASNVYYELEDLRDIKDRTVLKIYETDGSSSRGSDISSRSPSRSPKIPHSRGTYSIGSGHESDTSIRSAPLPRSPIHHPAHRPYSQEITSKTASLPVGANYGYSQQMAAYGTSGYSGLVGTQRHSVAYLPEQNAAAAAAFQPPGAPLPQSRSYQDYYDGSSRSGSATPTATDAESQKRMDKMEAQLANLAAWVQTAVVMKDGGSRPGSARSNNSISSDNSAKSNHEVPQLRVLPPDDLDNAHVIIVPSPTGLSDVSTATPTQPPVVNSDVQQSIRVLQSRAKELKEEYRTLRRMQLQFAETMRDTISQTCQKIRDVLPGVPGANDQPIRAHRSVLNNDTSTYQDDASNIERDLRDLEQSVEELRNDVLNKRCRVNMNEVEMMALALSNISKALADLKGKFPLLNDKMKTVMAGEMEIVVKEEKFLRDEPERLDGALKRCKKLTGTLFTLKRLASVQEQRPPTSLNLGGQAQDEDRKQLLENIEAMVPNHEQRVQSLEQADAVRERKKNLAVKADALRFEKGLELASKQLRPTSQSFEDKVNVKPVENGGGGGGGGSPTKANIPMTDTTKRLSQVGGSPPELESPTHTTDDAAAENGEEKEKEEEEHEEGDAPPKPPRLNDNTPDATTPPSGYNADIAVNKEGGEQNQPSSPPLATFGGSQETSPNDTMDMTSQSIPPASPTKIPVHSTPMNANKGQVHVTFCSTVTEICSQSPNSDKKKVPPPPPPRRSSRLAMQSPQGNNKSRPFSPPAYENIDNFNMNMAENADLGGNGNNNRPLPVLSRSASDSSKDGSPVPNDNSKPKGRGMSKYQQELAAGIYANMNRPDLQNQRVNVGDVVRDPLVRDSSALRNDNASSDSESTTSSVDSQSGVVMRRHKADDKGRKIPPPPPVRRTSALSNISRQTIHEHRQEEDIYENVPKRHSTPERPLVNGDSESGGEAGTTRSVQSMVSKFNSAGVKKSNIHRPAKKYEETEIY